MIGRLVVWVLLCFLCAACSLTPGLPVEDYRPALMKGLGEIEHWSLEGRLALRSEQDSVSVSILWRHHRDQNDIELFWLLGQGRVKISASQERVVVDDGENVKTFYSDADKVVVEQFGVDLPIRALRFWILGLNEPGSPVTEQTRGFYQNGWLVTYREMQWVNTRLMPRNIMLRKDKTTVKLIVDQWDIT